MQKSQAVGHISNQWAAFKLACLWFEIHRQLTLEIWHPSTTLQDSEQASLRIRKLISDLRDHFRACDASLFDAGTTSSATHSLSDCEKMVYEVFENGSASGRRFRDLQQTDRLEAWEDTDRGAFADSVTTFSQELLGPTESEILGLIETLPPEVRCFFQLCRLTYEIPSAWKESSADRHAHLIDIIRPELQATFDRCVSEQPGLAAIDIPFLPVEDLEYWLRSLRHRLSDVLEGLACSAAPRDQFTQTVAAEDRAGNVATDLTQFAADILEDTHAEDQKLNSPTAEFAVVEGNCGTLSNPSASVTEGLEASDENAGTNCDAPPRSREENNQQSVTAVAA